MKKFIVIALAAAGTLLALPLVANIFLLVQDHSYASHQKPYLHKDYTLIQRSRELGIDVSELNLYIRVEQANDIENAQAVFTPPNTITVQPGLSTEAQRQLLAAT